MSYNLGMIISMVFVVAFVLLGGDMYCLSSAYSALDNTSITVGYLIAKSGRVDNEYLSSLETKYKITFEDIDPQSPSPGDPVDFTIYRMYTPLVISTNQIKIVAKRSTVVGYYG